MSTALIGALKLIQSEWPNYHPLVSLVRLAHKKEVIDDPRLELEVHKTILPYVAPRLANLEVKAEVKEQKRITVSLFEDIETKNGSRFLPALVDAEDIVNVPD